MLRTRDSTRGPIGTAAIRGGLITLVICLFLPATAQDESFRVFLRFQGTSDGVAALEAARLRFERVIYRGSAIEFAGTTEMEADTPMASRQSA